MPNAELRLPTLEDIAAARANIKARAIRKQGLFIHPVAESAVIAGNATIDAEILEDLPSVSTIVVPFGGGGLAAGIGSVMRRISPGHWCDRPSIRQYVRRSYR